MRNILFVLALAFALPVAAAAQGFPGMTPEMAAQLQQIRTDGATATYNALSADHRTKVQAIITQFNSGSLTIPDAVKQIDSILTTDESKAVLDQGRKTREAMRKAFQAANGGSEPPMPPRPQATGQDKRPAPDAGRVLLQIAADQNALRAAMQQP